MSVVKRILNGLAVALSVALVAVIVVAVGMSLAQKRSPTHVAQFDGHLVLTVLSGSMTPVIRTGDVIVDHTVTAAQANALHVGQIVTYEVPGKTFHGQPFLITHRIVGVLTATNQATGQATHLYRTKGDANNVADPGLVSPSQILGVYSWRIPRAGYIVAFVHRPLGFGLLVVLPALYLIGSEFLRLWKLFGDDEEKSALTDATALPAIADGGSAPPQG
jgi:signal peptidase